MSHKNFVRCVLRPRNCREESVESETDGRNVVMRLWAVTDYYT